MSKPGGTIDDSELVNGLVLDTRPAHAAGGPTRIEGARIALIQVGGAFCQHSLTWVDEAGCWVAGPARLGVCWCFGGSCGILAGILAGP